MTTQTRAERIERIARQVRNLLDKDIKVEPFSQTHAELIDALNMTTTPSGPRFNDPSEERFATTATIGDWVIDSGGRMWEKTANGWIDALKWPNITPQITASSAKLCRTCRNFNAMHGQCRMSPPVRLPRAFSNTATPGNRVRDEQIAWSWPAVKDDDWCGEWEAQELTETEKYKKLKG